MNGLKKTIKSILARSIKILKGCIRQIKKNKKAIKTFMIFTGLVFFPVFLILGYLAAIMFASLFLEEIRVTGACHAFAWIFALFCCGALLLVNLYNMAFRKKRCFSSIREWVGEEAYSMARARAMYPPVSRELLYKEITGLCLGMVRTVGGVRYVCIDPDNPHVANHTLVNGNTGSGKSSGLVMTSLIANFKNSDNETPPKAAYLVIDPKPELYKLSCKGSKWARMLNPKAPRGMSYGWDLYYELDENSDIDKVSDVIGTIVSVIVQDTNEKNAFFQDSARNLLCGALIFEYVVNRRNFIQSMRIVLSSQLDAYVKDVMANERCPQKVVMLISEYGGDDKKTDALKDIQLSLRQQAAVFTRSDAEWFLDTDINKMACSPRLLDESVSLFLSIPRADLEYFGVLFRLITTQCISHLARRKDYDKNKSPVIFILDEFTNLGGKIPNFCENLGFIRSKKVLFVPIIQQYSQLEELYGKEEARTILNMGSLLVLTCEDVQLAKILSDKAGEFTSYSASYANNGTKYPAHTLTEKKEKRIRVMDDLASLVPRFESIVFINGSQYFRISKCRYYQMPAFKSYSDECRELNSSEWEQG